MSHGGSPAPFGEAAEGAGRWFGVGCSTNADASAAGTDAISQALSGPDPNLIIVFCSPRLCLQSVADAVGALAPGVPMIGCTTAGEISTGWAGGRSVSVAVLGGGYSVATTCAPNASEDLVAAGSSAASVVADLPPTEHKVVMLLTDGLGGNQQDVVRGAYRRLGAGVPLVGGCAGDDAAMVKTFQLFNGARVENAVVAAAIGSDGPIGIGAKHGWRPVGEPMLVTRSGDTGVVELDGEPAIDRYLTMAGAPASLKSDAAAFTTFAVTHPLGLRRRASEEVRFITGADFDAGALTSIAEIPQGSLVWLMQGDRESVLAGTVASCEEALAQLGEHEPIGLLMFDCIARKTVLGDDGVAAEMAAVSGALPSVPTAGFYTYGEIARTQGVRGFHNQTLVTLALA